MDSMLHPERAKIAWTMMDILRGGRLRAQTYRFMWAFNWNWWLDAVDEVHAFVNPHIRSTFTEIDERERRVQKSLDVGPERTDLLWSMATNLRDEEQLRSQLCLIIVPNNDTTSIFISNCLWYLARHPEAWKKLRLEIANLGEKPLTFETLRGMKYLEGILNESKSPANNQCHPCTDRCYSPPLVTKQRHSNPCVSQRHSAATGRR